MRSFCSFACLLVLVVAVTGCGGPRNVTEARENPGSVAGDQQTVTRGTAMSERSMMGETLIGSLQAATENARAGASEPSAELPVQFHTLLTALDEAELTETFEGEGPFTLFAPTDAAFQKMSTVRLEALMTPENREQLRELLRAHVVEGNYAADELAERSPVTTLAGTTLRITGEDQGIMVEGVRVSQADAGVSNGIIHVVEEVLLPPSMR